MYLVSRNGQVLSYVKILARINKFKVETDLQTSTSMAFPKTAGSLLVFLRVANTNNTRQNVSLFINLVSEGD